MISDLGFMIYDLKMPSSAMPRYGGSVRSSIINLATASRPRRHQSSISPGFTLTELLVVIGLIILLVGVGVPSVKSIMTSARVDNNSRTVAAAVAAARSFATGVNSAALFTPAGEIRYVSSVSGGVRDTGGAPLPSTYKAFFDVPNQDYVRLPSNVGVVGISRARVQPTNPKDNPVLLTPPFAVQFNSQRMVVVDDPVNSNFYYDANYDGADNGGNSYPFSNSYTGQSIPRIEIQTGVLGSTREDPFDKTGAFYNPDDWNPASSNYVPDLLNKQKPGLDPDSHQQRLPFERIETVTAVIVYDKNAFHAAGFTLESQRINLDGGGFLYPLNFDPDAADEGGDARRWLLKHGSTLVFNRYDGKIVKE